jgi:WD40 repeat protein
MSPLLVLGAALLLQAPEPVRRLGTQRFNHAEILVAVAMSPDGRVLATGDGKFCRLWNAETGAPIGDPVAGGRCLAFSPDGMLVASGDSTQVQILEAATGKS